MQVKKGIFGYIVGTLATLVMSLNLYLLFVELFTEIDLSSNFEFSFFNIPIEAFCGVSAVILCCGVFALIIFFKHLRALKKSPRFNEKALNIVSMVFFAIILILFLSFNIYNIESYTVKDFNYLQYSKVTDYFEGTSVNFDNFIEAEYFVILRFLLKVFGFFDNVIVYYNLLLCVAAIVLFSLSARLMFGTLTMPFISIGLTFIAFVNDLIYDLTGILLWFLFVSIIVYIASYFCEANKNKYPLTILLIFLAVVFFFKGMREIVFIPSFFLFNFSFDSFIGVYSSHNYFGIALTLFALYGCLSFYITKKNRIVLPEIIFLIEIFWILFDRSGYLNSYVIIMSLSLLAGMGMYVLIYPVMVSKKVKTTETANVESVSTDKEQPVEVKAEKLHIEEITKESVISSIEKIEENINTKPPTEKVAEAADIKPSKEKTAEAADIKPLTEKAAENTEIKPSVEKVKDNTDKKPEIKFIDNPLPGPKKHVKKELKFAFEPDEKDMHFDIDIKDGDDFEL